MAVEPVPAQPVPAQPVPAQPVPARSSTFWTPTVVGLATTVALMAAILVFAAVRSDGNSGATLAGPTTQPVSPQVVTSGMPTLEAPSPMPPSGSPVAAAIPEGWQTCSNTVHGYSISYPGGWYTTDSVSKWNGVTVQKPSLACNYFNPKPFLIYWGTEPPTTAIVVSTEDQGLQATATAHADPRYLTVVGRNDTAIAGRPAVVLEVKQTGDGYYPRGTLEYQYVIEQDESHSLVASTMHFPGSRADYSGTKATLDQVAQTVTFP